MGTQKMEKVSRLVALLLALIFVGCSSRPLLKEEAGQFEDIRKEFDSVVTVKETKPVPTSTPTPVASAKVQTTPIQKPKASTVGPLKQKGGSVKSVSRGRRPAIDPFRPEESVELGVTYLNMNAGVIKMNVEPFKEVNGRQAYHFAMSVESRKAFSMIYSVLNKAETFMDFERMAPITLTMDQNESSRLVETKLFFDAKNKKANLWEKEVSKKKGERKKELHWDIPEFAQNTISALYYVRSMELYPGASFEFPVIDDGKNYVFKGKVLRAETIDTEIGQLDTLVIKPEFHLEGSLKPTGENLFWLTNDDRKFLVRIKAKVKIGNLYADVISIKK